MIIPNIWENKKCPKPPTRWCLTHKKKRDQTKRGLDESFCLMPTQRACPRFGIERASKLLSVLGSKRRGSGIDKLELMIRMAGDDHQHLATWPANISIAARSPNMPLFSTEKQGWRFQPEWPPVKKMRIDHQLVRIHPTFAMTITNFRQHNVERNAGNQDMLTRKEPNFKLTRSRDWFCPTVCKTWHLSISLIKLIPKCQVLHAKCQALKTVGQAHSIQELIQCTSQCQALKIAWQTH